MSPYFTLSVLPIILKLYLLAPLEGSFLSTGFVLVLFTTATLVLENTCKMNKWCVERQSILDEGYQLKSSIKLLERNYFQKR